MEEYGIHCSQSAANIYMSGSGLTTLTGSVRIFDHRGPQILQTCTARGRGVLHNLHAGSGLRVPSRHQGWEADRTCLVADRRWLGGVVIRNANACVGDAISGRILDIKLRKVGYTINWSICKKVLIQYLGLSFSSNNGAD